MTAREVLRQPMMAPGGPSEPGAVSPARGLGGARCWWLWAVGGWLLGVEGGLDGWIGMQWWELHLVVAECE